MYITVSILLPEIPFFWAVYLLRYAIHLGSLGCTEEARVAYNSLVLSNGHILPSGGWMVSPVMLCLFLVVRLTKSKGKVSRLWLVKTSGTCWKRSFIISCTLDSS